VGTRIAARPWIEASPFCALFSGCSCSFLTLLRVIGTVERAVLCAPELRVGGKSGKRVSGFLLDVWLRPHHQNTQHRSATAEPNRSPWGAREKFTPTAVRAHPVGWKCAHNARYILYMLACRQTTAPTRAPSISSQSSAVCGFCPSNDIPTTPVCWPFFHSR
jgi:hypothetical protein